MSKAMRQMPQQCGRVGETCGEAGREAASDEADVPSREHPRTGSAMPMASTGGLLEAALTRENLQAAWRRVKANKGAAGVDVLDIEHTAQVLRARWPQIRQSVLAGTYRCLVARQDMLSDALNLDDSILVLLDEASVRLRGTGGCVASSPCVEGVLAGRVAA